MDEIKYSSRCNKVNIGTDGRKERMSNFHAVSKLQFCPARGTMRLAG